jgi:hypothetical protein
VTLTPTKKAVISTTGDDKKVATIHMYIHTYVHAQDFIHCNGVESKLLTPKHGFFWIQT